MTCANRVLQAVMRDSKGLEYPLNFNNEPTFRIIQAILYLVAKVRGPFSWTATKGLVYRSKEQVHCDLLRLPLAWVTLCVCL